MYSEALCNFQSLVPSVQCAIGCKCSPGCILYCLPLSIESTCNAYLCICVYLQYLLSSIHICHQQFNTDDQDPTNSGLYIDVYWFHIYALYHTVCMACTMSFIDWYIYAWGTMLEVFLEAVGEDVVED